MAILIVLMTGCAIRTSSILEFKDKYSFEISDEFCRNWSNKLDSVIKQDGVRDFGATRVEGYPYLRVNRFLASFSDLVHKEPSIFNDWISAMVDLNWEGRQIEINNLSETGLLMLGNDRLTIQDVDSRCSVLIKRSYTEKPFDNLSHLRKRVSVPDDYSTVKRVLGFYSFLKIPFVQGIGDWHKEARDTFDRYMKVGVEAASSRRYEPTAKKILQPNEVAELLRQRDSLGRLTLPPDLLSKLFVTYAPVLTIEDSGEFDRIGAVNFSNSGKAGVNTSEPTVYTHLTHTRFEGKTLPQLVYVAWFSARPKENIGDLLGGNLDGIMWRVTLDYDGGPLVFDSIHPCGCYHMFFPTGRLTPTVSPSKYTEWAFSPKQFNEVTPDLAVNITVQTKTHYLADVAFGTRKQEARVYALRDYNDLRSIKTAKGHRNLFGVNGIVSGSERGERFLLWPSGIASPGAMRQWGRHATAFVGRRHFDDARLLDKYYIRR